MTSVSQIRTAGGRLQNIEARERERELLIKIPAEYIRQWQAEGWDVFYRTDDGTFEIAKFDDIESVSRDLGFRPSREFANDLECIAYVVARASEGSKPHLLALWLDGRSAMPTHPCHSWLPPELLPEPDKKPDTGESA